MSNNLDAIVARLRSGSTYDDRTDAADLIEVQEAEITRLRAELATARREGMEEAAQIALSQPETIGEKLFNASKFQPDLLMTATCISMKRSIATAIRAAAGEGK